MAMQPYSLTNNGLSYAYSNGSLTSTTVMLSDQRSLDDIITTNTKQTKTFHPHRYNKRFMDYPKGWFQATQQFADGGVSTTRQEGCLTNWFNQASLVHLNSTMPHPYGKAVSKLYDKIRDNNGLNLAVDIAEWKQLQAMILGSAKATSQLVTTFEKIFRRKTLAISNAWLMYQYGIRPLMSTIHGLCEFMPSIVEQIKVKARASSKETISGYGSSVSNFTSLPHLVETSVSRRCELGIVYSITDPALFDTNRLSSLNPLSIAWELVPYSFVADWFVDVGGYLADWEAALFNGLTFHSGYRTDSYMIRTTGSVSGIKRTFTGWPYVTDSADIKWRLTTNGLNRTLLNGPPRPPVPSIKVNLGSQRLLSAAALLRQLLKI